MKPWVAFFSQTGSEIAGIMERTGRKPVAVVHAPRTAEFETRIHPNLQNSLYWAYRSYEKPARTHYYEILNKFGKPDELLITLNGWLYIVPGVVCEEYAMYNGHPGLITKYPDLKGKDPQKKAWLAKYPTVGTVIHKVSSEVDGGQIILSNECSSEGCKSEVDMVNLLKDKSLDLWVQFFEV